MKPKKGKIEFLALLAHAGISNFQRGECMQIPKIIHQTWKTDNFPDFIADCVASLRRTNPDWNFRFYADSDWEAIVSGSDMFDLDLFRKIPTAIQQADILRCLVLYEQGGVYSDVDVIGVRPLTSLIQSSVEAGIANDETEVLLCTDHPIHCRELYVGSEPLMNHFIVSKPRAKFLRIYLEYARDLAARSGGIDSEPVYTTGPYAMTELVERNGGAAAVNIGVMPYFWTLPLPDMTLRFAERDSFNDIILDGSWLHRFCPYVVHCWWHNYWSDCNMMAEYAAALFPPAR